MQTCYGFVLKKMVFSINNLPPPPRLSKLSISFEVDPAWISSRFYLDPAGIAHFFASGFFLNFWSTSLEFQRVLLPGIFYLLISSTGGLQIFLEKPNVLPALTPIWNPPRINSLC